MRKHLCRKQEIKTSNKRQEESNVKIKKNKKQENHAQNSRLLPRF